MNKWNVKKTSCIEDKILYWNLKLCQVFTLWTVYKYTNIVITWRYTNQ